MLLINNPMSRQFTVTITTDSVIIARFDSSSEVERRFPVVPWSVTSVSCVWTVHTVHTVHCRLFIVSLLALTSRAALPVQHRAPLLPLSRRDRRKGTGSHRSTLSRRGQNINTSAPLTSSYLICPTCPPGYILHLTILHLI